MSKDQGKQPEFFFDNEPVQWDKPQVTGSELRAKFAVPANVQIFQKIPGQKDREIKNDTVVQLDGKGPERFSTQSVGSGAGLQGGSKPLLMAEDYEHLRERGLAWEEDANTRFLVFKNFPLSAGLYRQDCADVLVQIPANYNHDGIDMLWLSPRLERASGKEVPKQMPYGSGNNLHHAGAEFCRWSRHWNEKHNQWRAGVDAIETILRRVTWALENPDANQA